MKIKVFVKTEGCLPRIIEKGDWIDLHLAEEVKLMCPFAKTLKYKKKKELSEEERVRLVSFNHTIAPLGVCMELPEGFEAIIVPRSSTFGDYGVLMPGSCGVIDNTYCSDKDEWKMPLLATRKVIIPKGTRIAQFRIQLSQKATMWQKLKWLFSSSIEIVQVKSLNNPPREGFGSTNKQQSND